MISAKQVMEAEPARRYIFVKGLYCVFSVVCHDCRRLCGMVRRSNYIKLHGFTWPYFGMVIGGNSIYLYINGEMNPM